MDPVNSTVLRDSSEPPATLLPADDVEVAFEESGVPRRAIEVSEASWVGRVWQFGRAHAAVIGVVCLVALLGGVWSIVQARAVPVAVAAPTPIAPAHQPSPTPPPPPPERLRVHVLGEVELPGVVRLAPGARVEDAIAAAGGLTTRAAPGELNLAAPLSDGAQIVIGTHDNPGGDVRAADGSGGGTASASGGAGAGGGSSERLDLNVATAAQLNALPGVGPVTAQSIVSWRDRHERFTQVEELMEIDGIGPKTFQRLEPLVRVG